MLEKGKDGQMQPKPAEEKGRLKELIRMLIRMLIRISKTHEKEGYISI